jgi:hypothetical protein
MKIKFDPGTESFIKYARKLHSTLASLRADLNLPVMNKSHMIDGTRIDIRSAEFGDWIRISGGAWDFSVTDYDTKSKLYSLDKEQGTDISVIPQTVFRENGRSYGAAYDNRITPHALHVVKPSGQTAKVSDTCYAYEDGIPYKGSLAILFNDDVTGKRYNLSNISTSQSITLGATEIMQTTLMAATDDNVYAGIKTSLNSYVLSLNDGLVYTGNNISPTQTQPSTGNLWVNGTDVFFYTCDGTVLSVYRNCVLDSAYAVGSGTAYVLQAAITAGSVALLVCSAANPGTGAYSPVIHVIKGTQQAGGAYVYSSTSLTLSNVFTVYNSVVAMSSSTQSWFGLAYMYYTGGVDAARMIRDDGTLYTEMVYTGASTLPFKGATRSIAALNPAFVYVRNSQYLAWIYGDGTTADIDQGTIVQDLSGAPALYDVPAYSTKYRLINPLLPTLSLGSDEAVAESFGGVNFRTAHFSDKTSPSIVNQIGVGQGIKRYGTDGALLTTYDVSGFTAGTYYMPIPEYTPIDRIKTLDSWTV